MALKSNIIYFAFLSRAENEIEFREFLEIVAVILCSDIEIGPSTFHSAAKGHGVSAGYFSNSFFKYAICIERSKSGLTLP